MKNYLNTQFWKHFILYCLVKRNSSEISGILKSFMFPWNDLQFTRQKSRNFASWKQTIRNWNWTVTEEFGQRETGIHLSIPVTTWITHNQVISQRFQTYRNFQRIPIWSSNSGFRIPIWLTRESEASKTLRSLMQGNAIRSLLTRFNWKYDRAITPFQGN